MNNYEIILRTVELQHQELLELKFFEMSGELSKIRQTIGDSVGMSKENCISILRAFEEPLIELNNLIDVFRRHLIKHYPKEYADCIGDGEEDER